MATARIQPDSLETKVRLALEGNTGYVALTRDEEAELSRRFRAGNREAGWALAMANQNFVRSIAQRYLRDELDLDDLVAEGLLGLMDAAERFDDTRGIKFITYGIWWIKRSILRFLRQVGHPVHVPKYKEHDVLETRRAQARLAQELGRTPTLEELCAATGASPRDAQTSLSLSQRPECLSSVPEEGDLDLPDPGTSPEDDLVHEDALARLAELLPKLDARDHEVVLRRFGLDGREITTLAELGNELGLTKERVRQIELSACAELRGGLEGAKRPTRRPRRQARSAALAPCA